MVILDTNIVIDHLRQKQNTGTFFNKICQEIGEGQIGLCAVSVQELYAGKSIARADKEKELLDIFRRLQILPYDFDCARLAGKLVRESRGGMHFADAAIAAAAILQGVSLVTLNKKHFEGIKGLELL